MKGDVMKVKIEVDELMASEIRQWAQDEADAWPSDTAFQAGLADLLRQLDDGLPSAADVRGIMAP